MTGKNFCVITSIFSPTETIEKLANNKNWPLIVIGDKKTPDNWSHQDVTYLSVEDCDQKKWKFPHLVPLNTYARKNIGYLEAIQKGAEIIYDTDDDNAPYDDWAPLSFDGDFLTTHQEGFLNIYKYFTDQFIWPRGFPLNLIKQTDRVIDLTKLQKKKNKVGIWQALADGDPDVDAIYRLLIEKECIFDKKQPICFAQGSVCPINSQATFFRKECFPLLYLPTYVQFRFIDILRGIIAQPLLWSQSYCVGFMSSIVFQDRNPHDYMKDFSDEVDCYLRTKESYDIACHHAKSNKSLSDNLWNCYLDLIKENIVGEQELPLLSAWLEDLEKVS